MDGTFEMRESRGALPGISYVSLDRQMDITVKILAVATMLAVAVLTLGLLAPTGNRLLPK
jgi:hypothetical protein